jgi:hypothetical protein
MSKKDSNNDTGSQYEPNNKPAMSHIGKKPSGKRGQKTPLDRQSTHHGISTHFARVIAATFSVSFAALLIIPTIFPEIDTTRLWILWAVSLLVMLTVLILPILKRND